MKIAVALVKAGAAGDTIAIPNQYPAISKLLGVTALTFVASTTSGAITVNQVDVDADLVDSRTIKQNTALSNGGFLVVVYEPVIEFVQPVASGL